MAVVWIPPLVRDLAGGRQTVMVTGKTVRQVIVALEQQFPGIGPRLADEGGLRPGLTVVVDGVVAPLGLLQQVGDTSEVHFLPAIGGGGPQRLMEQPWHRAPRAPRITDGTDCTDHSGSDR